LLLCFHLFSFQMLQGAMFMLFCIIDFAPLREKRKLQKFRDHTFLSLSLPTCIFVSTFFWGLYIFDRELIFPKQLELYYPAWLNHLSVFSAFMAVSSSLPWAPTLLPFQQFVQLFQTVNSFIT
ncbi:hypothetical protein HPB47_013313, partial [Ixodes persulcatus]